MLTPTDAQELPWSKRWPFDVPYWSCKLVLDKIKPRPWTHGSSAILLESTFRVSAVALSLSTVKHGSFLFAYFLEQMKKLNFLKNCACLGLCANILYILQLLTNEINLWWRKCGISNGKTYEAVDYRNHHVKVWFIIRIPITYITGRYG